jgi:hypothetical protein
LLPGNTSLPVYWHRIKATESNLWIGVMTNMLKADILSLYIPGVAEEVARTSASTYASLKS